VGSEGILTGEFGDAVRNYYLIQAIEVVGGAAFLFLFTLFGCWVMSGYCGQCGRKKQWRWRVPNVYAKRSHCVFCEE
jgi:hypothetical protein